MYLAYGPHKHAIGECQISIARDTVVNAGHQPIAVREVWSIEGMLFPSPSAVNTSADIDAQIAALIAAYSTDGYDLIFYLPDGSTPSSTSLYSTKTLGGTRVTKKPSFLKGQGPERVTYATFSLQVEAEVPEPNAANFLLDWKETLKVWGGGLVFGWLKPVVGQPVQVLLFEQDTYKAIQDGHATGYLQTPTPAAPIWPGYLLKAPEYDLDSPDVLNTAYRGYPIKWHYEFEADVPLSGAPTPWPL